MPRVQILFEEREHEYRIVCTELESGACLELSEETFQRYTRIRKEYDEMQAEIAALYEVASIR